MKHLLSIVFCLLSFALSALADKYVIYPIPQIITMGEGTLALSSEVKVVYESGIDQATRTRLESLLAQHGITASAEADAATSTVIRLGIVDSNEEVATHATDVLALKRSRIMVSKKFDRHAISVSEHGITLLGEHTNAVFWALSSLEQMLEQQLEGTLAYTTIYDHADQQNRGLVEGYYGYPYSVEVKKELMRFMMRHKMNTYMYGAKSDPYHSQMWTEAYPTTITAEQEKNGWLTQDMIRDLAKVSEETKVNFIWAIHPGNSFVGSSTAINDIMSKFEKMHALGVRQFGVFVDDVGIPSSDADMKTNADRLSGLQTAIEQRWNTEGAEASDTVRPLHFVPQIYCNSFASTVDQRQRFMAALSAVQDYITVYSTGQGVWSVPNNDHTATVKSEFTRAMSWWWNYPCNDNADGQLFPMDMYSNFVDMPSVGNGERLPSTLNNCSGIVSNPMQQGSMARTALFSVADYAWNNTAFNNANSWEASFKALIEDEILRQAYHDITYYLRWNEPESMQTLINAYKTSLEAGTPASSDLRATIEQIQNNCRTVMTMKDSSVQTDKQLYTDIAPWLHSLHTYTIVTLKMLDILDSPEGEMKSQWLNVKEVADSLYALEHSTLYTAYALEGMGNGISVSWRQAQLSRNYWYPFISYLKERAIDPYFHDANALTQPTAIGNSPLLQGMVSTLSSTVSFSLAASDLDVNKYVGIALPKPYMLEGATIAENLLPHVRYSLDGKRWSTITAATDLAQKYAKYIILRNESGAGIKDFAVAEGEFAINLTTQAKPTGITIPSGNVWQGHTGELMIDGDYNTFTCLNRNQQSGDNYVIDLGQATTIHDVRMYMGTTNGDHPTACRVQVSENGSKWTNLKIKGTTIITWKIDLEQNVRYSDNSVYCDFDGASTTARYVRIYLSAPNTSKWARIYELEVNRQHAESNEYTVCSDGNGNDILQLTDGDAVTGMPTNAPSPLTYALNSIHDASHVTFYTLPSATQPSISVTTNGTDWTTLGTLTEACHSVDLQAYPGTVAVRLEWQGGTAPAIYEVMADYDLSTTSLPDEESALAKEFAQMKALAFAALDSCGQYEKLITENSQFSSPYSQTDEGSLNNLLDGKLDTYWHSIWAGGDKANGLHYLEIALPEDTKGDVVMHMGRRSSGTADHLTLARIQGIVYDANNNATVENVCELQFPYASATETLVRRFNLPKAYDAIRLLELETTNNRGYFHIGEMQLYNTAPHYILKGMQAEADALLAACAPMPSEATEDDLQTLRQAYATFMHNVLDVPTGIVTIPSANGGETTIYDLTGRRIAQPQRGGLYIVGGKKVFIK